MSSIERDVLDRLDGLDLAWYVTGSWALAACAELGIRDRLEGVRAG